MVAGAAAVPAWAGVAAAAGAGAAVAGAARLRPGRLAPSHTPPRPVPAPGATTHAEGDGPLSQQCHRHWLRRVEGPAGTFPRTNARPRKAPLYFSDA